LSHLLDQRLSLALAVPDITRRLAGTLTPRKPLRI